MRRLAVSASWSSTASTMRACASRDADSVLSPSEEPSPRKYRKATRLRMSTKSSRAGLRVMAARRACRARWSRTSDLLAACADRRHRPSVRRSVGQLGRDHLEDDARLEHLIEAGVGPVQVQHRGVDDGVDRRLRHDEPAAGPPSHGGHLLVLDQPHGLAEDGPAHPVALDQLGLRAQHLAHGQPRSTTSARMRRATLAASVDSDSVGAVDDDVV